jgi:hypothetical protein
MHQNLYKAVEDYVYTLAIILNNLIDSVSAINAKIMKFQRQIISWHVYLDVKLIKYTSECQQTHEYL